MHRALKHLFLRLIFVVLLIAVIQPVTAAPTITNKATTVTLGVSGKPATVRLQGTNLHEIVGARLLQKGRQASGFKISLGKLSPDRKNRYLSLATVRPVKPGNYQLQVLYGDRSRPRALTIATSQVQVRIVGAPRSRTVRKPVKPVPTRVRPECTSDAHCSSNEYCAPSKKCVSKLQVGLPCTSNMQCGTANCAEGICRCTGNSQCPEGGVCQTSTGICVECASNAHCSSNEYCASSKKCVSKLPMGSPCMGNMQCGTAYCASGFCRCTNNSQCPEGRVCRTTTGICVECTNNTHCSSNEYCAPSIGNCVECTSNAHCSSSEYCGPSMKCVSKLPTGSPCVSNAQCETTNCPGGVCQ